MKDKSLSSKRLHLLSKEWKTILNRDGMANIALNFLTFIERMVSKREQQGNQEEEADDDVDVSFLLSSQFKNERVDLLEVTPPRAGQTNLGGANILDHLIEPFQVKIYMFYFYFFIFQFYMPHIYSFIIFFVLCLSFSYAYIQ
jgi:hypothetical protein